MSGTCMSETCSGMARTSVGTLAAGCRLRGEISLLRVGRVTDPGTGARSFIAVTDAGLRADRRRIVVDADLLDVHRDRVQGSAPVDRTRWH